MTQETPSQQPEPQEGAASAAGLASRLASPPPAPQQLGPDHGTSPTPGSSGPVSNGKSRYDWAKLAAGGLAGLSLLGAYVSNFESGGASRSAGRALSAEEQAAIHASKVEETVTITEEIMERGRNRAAAMENRIAALEKEVAALEKRAEKGKE
jgi:hypothetical protein